MDWHYGNMLEVVSDTIPDEAALIHGDETRSWREFDATADALQQKDGGWDWKMSMTF
jgi:hypothetical protein